MVRNGIDNLGRHRSRFAGCRLALVTNPSGVNRKLASTLDILAEEFHVVKLFGPEHGVRGDIQAGGEVADYLDPRWQIPVYSTYGTRPCLKPELLEDVDRVVFDIQDIGARFYTFIHTLGDIMADCAAANVPLTVLDRVNPIGGVKTEGTLLDERFASFIGRTAIPARHGLTAGEYARFLNGEYRIGCDLSVIPCSGWTREMEFEETGLQWINPSPNMPSAQCARIFCGSCFFEGTNLSEGRGTTLPFELIGAPFLDGEELARHMNARHLPGVLFRSCVFTPVFHKNSGQLCRGVQIHVIDRNSFRAFDSGLLLLDTVRELTPELELTRQLDHLLGSDVYRTGAESAESIIRRGRRESRLFAEHVRQYHLYSPKEGNRS